MYQKNNKFPTIPILGVLYLYHGKFIFSESPERTVLLFLGIFTWRNMAREFAKAFYKSKQWRATREYIMRRDSYRCADCGGLAEEVHHIIELTPENINDPEVSVNEKNLVALCYKCHRARHERHGKAKKLFETDYRMDEEGNILPPYGH